VTCAVPAAQSRCCWRPPAGRSPACRRRARGRMLFSAYVGPAGGEPGAAGGS
jgi:hypothetical protein